MYEGTSPGLCTCSGAPWGRRHTNVTSCAGIMGRSSLLSPHLFVLVWFSNFSSQKMLTREETPDFPLGSGHPLSSNQPMDFFHYTDTCFFLPGLLHPSIQYFQASIYLCGK